jgi:hypothetical protein
MSSARSWLSVATDTTRPAYAALLDVAERASRPPIRHGVTALTANTEAQTRAPVSRVEQMRDQGDTQTANATAPLSVTSVSL